MTARPTGQWRRTVEEQRAAVAAGTLAADQAYASQLWPPKMIAKTDKVLTRFEADVAELVEADREPATDPEIRKVIKRTVKALNAVNDRFDGAAYETEERENLCAFIEGVLDGAGLDVDAYAGRNGMSRHEITDRWRDW